MEIIEIGALMQDTKTFEVHGEFQSFIKPVRHRALTDFCKQLTTISQAQVDSAPQFLAAMKSVTDWLADFEDYVFCSWGNYDRNQINQDCEFHNTTSPFGEEHINIKKEVAETLGVKKQMGISGALKRLHMDFVGTPHRGIDDVRNIARIVQKVWAGA